MKETLTEMKNDLQGISSRVDEAQNQISDLEYKDAKITQTEQQKEKRLPLPKMRIAYRTCETTSSVPTLASYVCQKERRERN